MFISKILLKRRFSISDIQILHTDVSNWIIDDSMHKKVKKEREKILISDKKEGKNRWDGTYYRVENIQDINDNKNPIILRLNTIKYRYLCTMNLFMDYYTGNVSRYPNHLSVAGMIETSDGYFVFGKRAGTDKIDLIGGGVQKDEYIVNNGNDLEETLRKEMMEEAGISDTYIKSLEGIGFVFSYKSNILLIAHIVLNIERDVLDKVFQSKLDDEMEGLMYIKKSKIENFMASMKSYKPLLPELLK